MVLCCARSCVFVIVTDAHVAGGHVAGVSVVCGVLMHFCTGLGFRCESALVPGCGVGVS